MMPTVRRLLLEHGANFLEWLEREAVFEQAFAAIADTLEFYIRDHLLLQPGAPRLFAEAIPKVIRQCDEPIYDQLAVADAYAFVHLLERYRRFWSVLVELVRVGALPMARTRMEILDVGTGPAPAAYAATDFYGALGRYISEHDIPLVVPTPHIDALESSAAMAYAMHILSEFSRRAEGPFRPTFTEFVGFDPRQERLKHREIAIRQYMDEWWDDEEMSYGEARAWVDQRGWSDVFRYRLCIFSYFLTRSEKVAELRIELEAVFRSLRRGGVLVVLGGTGGQYPDIYRKVEEVAVGCGCRRIRELLTEIVRNTDDFATVRIARLYSDVWRLLLRLRLVEETDPNYRNIWDPTWSLARPRSFGIRVFRKGGWPSRRGARYRIRRRVPN